MEYRTGIGFDVHSLASGRKLIIGGVEIESDKGLEGHSDADVLLHAVCDAILGAAALGDIGIHFPNTDPAYKNISSIRLLEKVEELIRSKGYAVGNVDSMIALERPKIAPYVSQMIKNISSVLKCRTDQVSVKATTTEKLGFTGRGEGAAAFATALLIKNV
jgi:2-C-methyl-D-erythritol 2,4-cyclodiphosphate synthase